jgi:5-methylthioadenosine/S-adenosylhomocysteine deaminase
MKNFKIIKNGLVLTLDPQHRAGYYDIILNEDKILEIDYKEDGGIELARKYAGAEVIDAAGKIVIPGLINANINSSYSFSKVFFRKSSYESLGSNISLSLLDRFFNDENNIRELENLLLLSCAKALYNGETTLAETSSYVSKAFFNGGLFNSDKIKQNVIYTSYESSFNNYLAGIGRFYLIGVRSDEEINNYTLSSVKKSLKEGENKLYLEILSSAKTTEEFRHNFNRSLVRVFADYYLLSQNTIFCNPIYVNHDDIDILNNSDVNIIFNPTDFLKLSKKNIEFEDFMSGKINLCIGTGFLGKDVLSEMKVLSELIYKSAFSYESILRMATVNPARMYNLSGSAGTIEKGKSADFVMFDIKDIRNTYLMPEMNSEKICEFVIENLNVKDISDVMIRGDMLIKEYRNYTGLPADMQQRAAALSQKVYSAGKYFEFKEKYLMRKRVNDITLYPEGAAAKKDDFSLDIETIPVDDSIPALEDSDFKIIGVQNAEALNYFSEFGGDVNENEAVIYELDSADKGLNIFDWSGDTAVKENVKLSIFLGKAEEVQEKEVKKEPEAHIEKKAPPAQVVKIKETPEVVFKKTKLRFGFSEDSKEKDND